MSTPIQISERLLLVLCGAVALTASVAQASGESVSLKPGYKAGQSMSYVQNIDRTDTMTAGSFGTRTTGIQQSITWGMQVLSADDKGTSIELKIARLTVSKQDQIKADAGEAAGDGLHEWDSAAPEDDKDDANPLVQAFKPIVGARFVVKMDSGGLIAGIENKDGAQVSTGTYGPFVRNLIDADSMKLRWQPVLSPKSGASSEAKLGDSWKEEAMLPSPPMGKIKFATTRTLKELKDSTATIEFTTALELLPEKEGGKTQGAIKDSGVSGFIFWDSATGTASKVNWNQKVTQDVSAQGIGVQRTTDQKIIYTRGPALVADPKSKLAAPAAEAPMKAPEAK